MCVSIHIMLEMTHYHKFSQRLERILIPSLSNKIMIVHLKIRALKSETKIVLSDAVVHIEIPMHNHNITFKVCPIEDLDLHGQD